jgi:hypothetical protein
MLTGSLAERYASIKQRASRKVIREFGYDLLDPFEEICGMLDRGEPFSFSRFGDGEFNAIFSVDGANIDGHRYFPDLGRRLAEILKREPDYIMGLQPLVVLMRNIKDIHTLSGDIRWVQADSLHLASMEGRLGGFFAALGQRRVLLVGAPHHRPLAERRSWQFVEVAYGDCWPQYESLCPALESHAVADGTVFLFCASMTANVLIDDLYRLNPRNTYIDVGSVFDPYVGVDSRDYHKELDPDPIRGLRRSGPSSVEPHPPESDQPRFIH